SETMRSSKNSGTNMFFELLEELGMFNNESFVDALALFVEKVRRYDTWEWKEKYNDSTSADLNTLFWIYGADKFLDKYCKFFKNLGRFTFIEGELQGMFDPADLAILEMEKSSKD